MSEPPNTVIEILKILLNFLSTNIVYIFVLILIVVFKDSIANFFSRMISFSLKKGDSQLDMGAVAPIGVEMNSMILNPDEFQNIEDKGPQIKEDSKEDVESEEGWLPKMHLAFLEKRFEDADEIFKEHERIEDDEVQLEKDKSLYLYLKYKKAGIIKAVQELENLVKIAINEDSKFNTLMWLSLCYEENMQFEKNTKLWIAALGDTKSEHLKTKAIVYLAEALNKENKQNEAKKLIIKRLSTVTDETEKASLYDALSHIEDSLGNKSLSIYCKDKSLEFDLGNKDKLFESAFNASDNDIDEISISNYVKLIQIDERYMNALNNLGVKKKEAGLRIKCVENYKKSAIYNNTLSMANQGFLLLEAGFADEAENIAKEAIKFEDPHPNVSRLITSIHEMRKKEKEDWDGLKEKSLSRQMEIRKYTEQYYLGNPDLIKGKWKVHNESTTFIIESDIIKANWHETDRFQNSYKVEMNGKVIGSTFVGEYIRENEDDKPNIMLGISGNVKHSCIGYLSDDRNNFIIISSKMKDSFSLILSRK